MKESIYLYGKNPLKEALLAITRGNKNLLHKVFLTKQGEADPTIMSLIQSYAISYDIVTADEIEHMVGKGTVHQGVCIKLNEDALYTPLDVVLQESNGSSKNKLIILLDELQDPHNVGAIIRSAVAFGADAILMPEHDQTQITGTVIKSSAGTSFAIPIVRIGNINKFVAS
jgi:23S rRNA (guanosine2251-2'-O)-methyltransferase